jgi:hypothetical protein
MDLSLTGVYHIRVTSRETACERQFFMNNAFRKIVGWLSLELGAVGIHHVTLRDVETLLMTDKTIEEDHLSKERRKKCSHQNSRSVEWA